MATTKGDYTPEEKEQIARYMGKLRGIKSARVAYAVRHRLRKKADKMGTKERIIARERQVAYLKTLAPGTKLLVLYQRLAGQTVELVKHGRQYAIIKTANGECWKTPYFNLTDDFGEINQQTARVNRDFQPLFQAMNEMATTED